MKTRAANLLFAVKNPTKLGHMNTAFGSTMVGIVEERIPSFTSFTKGIIFVAAFSKQ
jgi:hypothetical protein